MAWRNPFRSKDPNERSAWGYTFISTSEHLTPEQYEPLKHSYDTLGEAVLNRLNEISPPTSGVLPRRAGNGNEETMAREIVAGEEKVEVRVPESSVHRGAPDIEDGVGVDGREEGAQKEKEKEKPKDPPRDLYTLLRDHRESDELLNRFWEEVTTVPDWVDWDQISRGQDVFYRYGAANLTGLAYQSLLGGMGASRIVETLARTGGFSTKVARNRLFETTQHILQCTKSLPSIQPGGDGFASTIRVRLLHAAVRKRILKLAETRPDYFNVAEWGVPINDLDSIATIVSFSSTLIWLALPRQGIFLRQSEITDYVALWRYIAYVIGCPTAGFFETPAQAKRILESLTLHELAPSPTSQKLANNIIAALADQAPGHASAALLTAGARWLNGNPLCDALALPRPPPLYHLLIAAQCALFCFWAYAYRLLPPSYDRAKINLLKRVFWAIVVDGSYSLQGRESNFDFKYVPQFGTVAELGLGVGLGVGVGVGVGDAEIKDQRERGGLVLLGYRTGVEGRNLKVLVLGIGVLGLSVWATVKVGVWGCGILWRAVGSLVA